MIDKIAQEHEVVGYDKVVIYEKFIDHHKGICTSFETLVRTQVAQMDQRY